MFNFHINFEHCACVLHALKRLEAMGMELSGVEWSCALFSNPQSDICVNHQNQHLMSDDDGEAMHLIFTNERMSAEEKVCNTCKIMS